MADLQGSPQQQQQNRSTLEADGCPLISRDFKQSLRTMENLDSGVNMSYREDSVMSQCDVTSTGSDVKQQLSFRSVPYESCLSNTAVEIAAQRMEGLHIANTPNPTTIHSSTPSATQPEQLTANIAALPQLYTPDDDGDTKLHLAVIHPNPAVATWLTVAAASCQYIHFLNIQNHEFIQTALHLAVITNQPPLVRQLVICGAARDVRDRHGNTPMHLACARGLVKCILAMTRPVSQEEIDGLRLYCISSGLPVFEPTPFQMPDLNAVDYNGYSCLHMVQSWFSHQQLAEVRLPVIDHLIKNCGADVNIMDGKSGHALLHLAVRQKDEKLLGYLLQLPDINVNLQTYSKQTALDLADLLGNRDAIHQLEAFSARHSQDYMPFDSCSDDTEDDQMNDEYDDLVIGGQKLKSI